MKNKNGQIRIHAFIIGILAFVVFSIVLFATAGKVNNEFNTTISDDYNDIGDTVAQADTLSLIDDLSDNSPGGTEGISFSSDDNTVTGLEVTSLVREAPSIFKSILFGRHDGNNVTTKSLTSKLNIDPIWARFTFAGFLIVITIVLISSVLKNKW